MDVMGNSYMPGDPRLVEQIVYELKSQGIFDQFRKECISDVDTKPAYQNLRQRVEGRVTGFLTKQKWKPDMNKNQVREMLRKNIYESGFLETGVNRIVDQVVNPKINTVFHEKVEEIVYKFLGVQKPNTVKEELVVDVEQNDLLPTDLEAVSPDSDHTAEKKEECSFDSTDLNDSKNDDAEDESPPFEPLDADENLSFKIHEEHSRDSHMSGFSGLASHDSNQSSDIQIKPSQIEPINQDSRMSLNSSESRLSIVTSEDNSKMDVSDLAVDLKSEEISNGNLPMDICDNSTSSFEKFNDNKKDAEKQEEKVEETMTASDNNVNDVATKEEQENVVNNTENNLNSAQNDGENKPEKDKNEEVKIEDLNRDTPKDIKDETKKDDAKKDNDLKNDIKKEDKNKESSKEKDRKHEKSRDRSDKSSSRHSKDSRSSDKRSDSKHDKKHDDKDKKHSDKDRKSDKEKDKSRHSSSSSKDKDKYKERDRKDSRSHSSSSRSEKKSSDKDRSSSKSSSSKEKNRKDSTSSSRDKDKKSSSTSSKKESSSSLQKSKSSRDEKSKSSEKSHRDEKSSTKKEKERKRSSKDDHHSYKEKRSRRSTDRDSDGQSNSNKHSSSQKEATQPKPETSAQNLPSGSSGDSGTSDRVEQTEKVKINKPKFAANIKEAMKLMKIRKQLKKLEKENQISLSEVDYGSTSNEADNNTTKTSDRMNKSDNFKEPSPKPKETDAKIDVDSNESELKSEEIKDVEVPLQNVDISQAKWDSLQAKLMLEVTVDYNSYGNSDDEESFNATSVQDSSPIEDVNAPTEKSTPKTESDKTTETGKKTDTDKIKSPIKRTKSNAESKISPRETKSETKETKSPIKRTKSNAESESKSSIELKKKFTTLELENNFNIPTDEKLIQEIKVMLVDVLKPNVANGTLTSPIKPLQEKSKEKCVLPKMQPIEELSNVDDDKSDTEDCCKFLKSPTKTEEKKRKSMNLIIQKLETQISKIIIQIEALKNDSTATSECKIMVTKRKRQSSEHTDVKNNNKNDLCVVKRTKKADGENLGAKNESGVSEVNGFPLPLSPAESDQSNDVSLNTHNSIVKVEAKTKPKRVPTAKVPKLSQQRYSSEDLYKPRMNFSSRRRSAKNDT